MSKNIYRIPHYLKAISLDNLKEAMYLNNLKFDQEFGYFDIQREGNFWIAFYYADAAINPTLPSSNKSTEAIPVKDKLPISNTKKGK
jgi:hypothetical protein